MPLIKFNEIMISKGALWSLANPTVALRARIDQLTSINRRSHSMCGRDKHGYVHRLMSVSTTNRQLVHIFQSHRLIKIYITPNVTYLPSITWHLIITRKWLGFRHSLCRFPFLLNFLYVKDGELWNDRQLGIARLNPGHPKKCFKFGRTLMK